MEFVATIDLGLWYFAFWIALGIFFLGLILCAMVEMTINENHRYYASVPEKILLSFGAGMVVVGLVVMAIIDSGQNDRYADVIEETLDWTEVEVYNAGPLGTQQEFVAINEDGTKVYGIVDEEGRNISIYLKQQS